MVGSGAAYRAQPPALPREPELRGGGRSCLRAAPQDTPQRIKSDALHRADPLLWHRSRGTGRDPRPAGFQHPGRSARTRRSRPDGRRRLVFRQRTSTGGSAMAVYRRVLLVVDLTDDSLAIGRKAQALAAALGAEVELLHVVEFVPVEPMGETLMPAVQIEEELLQRAQQRLVALAAELGLAGAACRVESGNVKAEIVRVARERHADLIVLGSRERHGLSILVNLTEDTVLHAAPCDVLAVRVGPGPRVG